jgi:very-short-patch-repair endonuclease
VFEQTPINHLRGQNCPKCKYKTESFVCETLCKYTKIIYQFRLENKIFDFYLPEYNLIIERDGEQHYKNNTPFTTSLNVQIENDKFKTQLAINNNYKIARLPYWLSRKHIQIEIENILGGKPTYPGVPNITQSKTKPKPHL